MGDVRKMTDSDTVFSPAIDTATGIKSRTSELRRVFICFSCVANFSASKVPRVLRGATLGSMTPAGLASLVNQWTLHSMRAFRRSNKIP